MGVPMSILKPIVALVIVGVTLLVIVPGALSDTTGGGVPFETELECYSSNSYKKTGNEASSYKWGTCDSIRLRARYIHPVGGGTWTPWEYCQCGVLTINLFWNMNGYQSWTRPS